MVDGSGIRSPGKPGEYRRGLARAATPRRVGSWELDQATTMGPGAATREPADRSSRANRPCERQRVSASISAGRRRLRIVDAQQSRIDPVLENQDDRVGAACDQLGELIPLTLRKPSENVIG